MASVKLHDITIRIDLDNGTDGEGKQRIVSISLGKLNKDNFVADKAIAVIRALGPCLAKEILALYVHQTSNLLP